MTQELQDLVAEHSGFINWIVPLGCSHDGERFCAQPLESFIENLDHVGAKRIFGESFANYVFRYDEDDEEEDTDEVRNERILGLFSQRYRNHFLVCLSMSAREPIPSGITRIIVGIQNHYYLLVDNLTSDLDKKVRATIDEHFAREERRSKKKLKKEDK